MKNFFCWKTYPYQVYVVSLPNHISPVISREKGIFITNIFHNISQLRMHLKTLLRPTTINSLVSKWIDFAIWQYHKNPIHLSGMIFLPVFKWFCIILQQLTVNIGQKAYKAYKAYKVEMSWFRLPLKYWQLLIYSSGRTISLHKIFFGWMFYWNYALA